MVFCLVHGAWHGAWCFELLLPELESRGHEAVAVDLPCDDVEAGFVRYAEIVAAALEERDDVVLVGHSLAGLTIPLVAELRPVRALVYLCALLPVPGASLVDQLRAERDVFVPGFAAELESDELGRTSWPHGGAAAAALYPDCEPQVARRAALRLRPQARTPHREPCPLKRLPALPTVSVVAREDGAISPAWSRRAARGRLGLELFELPGGHSPFLARPAQLAALLESLPL